MGGGSHPNQPPALPVEDVFAEDVGQGVLLGEEGGPGAAMTHAGRRWRGVGGEEEREGAGN